MQFNLKYFVLKINQTFLFEYFRYLFSKMIKKYIYIITVIIKKFKQIKKKNS